MAVVPDGQPGRRFEGDDLAPLFRIEVNDELLSHNISRFIKSAEYESAVDLADLFKIVVDNPGVVDDFYPDWTAHKAFQPGNEASLYIGYGTTTRPENFVGRCQWVKHEPVFPREGMPQLELKGYDLSHKMMNNTGLIQGGGRNAAPVTKRPVDAADDQGQVFNNVLDSEIVAFIDATTKRDNRIIKKGQKHFELVKGLANLNNRDMWVDYDVVRRKWVLHWKDLNRVQAAQYILRYNSGDSGTLLEAEVEYGMRDTVTTATILIFDAKNQRWVSAIEIEDASGPDPIFHPGGGLAARSSAQRRPRKQTTGKKKTKPSAAEARAGAARRNAKDVINEALENAATFRIAAGGFTIDVLPPGNRFKSPDDAARYLLRWFKSRQDNFIKVRGQTIGIETLRARQVHQLRGLGVRLDGDYFFTSVRHKLSEDSYSCEFTANKVITG
jgi:hypothetical protein